VPVCVVGVVVATVEVVVSFGVVVVVDGVVSVVVEVVVVVVTSSQWSSLPLALPWSSHSCPCPGCGSGLQSLSLLPCEQSSPGDPGTVEGGPPAFGVPGEASAAETPRPVSSKPTSTAILAVFSLSPVIKILPATSVSGASRSVVA
jgi:hypothetical protein